MSAKPPSALLGMIAGPGFPQPPPPFITAAPDGSLTVELHQSQAASYMICPRRFAWEHLENLELSAPKAAVSFGTAMHGALAVRELGGTLEAQEAAIQAHFAANPAEDGEPRNAGRAIEALRAYDSFYPSEDWTVLSVEEEFKSFLGEFSVTEGALTAPVKVFIAGRKDLRVLWRGLRWVVDHKTGSRFDSSTTDNDHRSFQARLYLLHESSLPGPEVGGFLVNHIVWRSLTGKAPHTFHREPVFISAGKLSRFKEEVLSLVKEMVSRFLSSSEPSSFPEFTTACSHWGRCPFFDLCEAEPEKRPVLLASGLYRKRELYVPALLPPPNPLPPQH